MSRDNYVGSARSLSLNVSSVPQGNVQTLSFALNNMFVQTHKPGQKGRVLALYRQIHHRKGKLTHSLSIYLLGTSRF
jgi:hypothetical protein